MTPTVTLDQALTAVPDVLVDAFEREFGNLEARFARRDWSAAELNGGRLAEALFRYMEWKRTGSFTPLGNQIDRLGIVRCVKNDTSLPDGIRFHVRRCADLLLDFRNKRDVAHLGREIDVDEMDAHLVMRVAAWALSEIVRVEGGLPAEQAQRLINRLSATHLPLVDDVDGNLIVLATNLPAAQRALVALYHTYPEPLGTTALRQAVQYEHAWRFRNQVLKGEQDKRHLHVRDDDVYLTRKGVAWVEQNIDMELRLE